jgi:hypothetical protein
MNFSNTLLEPAWRAMRLDAVAVLAADKPESGSC